MLPRCPILLFSLLILLPILTHSLSLDACTQELYPVQQFNFSSPKNTTDRWAVGMIGNHNFSTSYTVSMMRFAAEYINNSTTILPNITLDFYGSNVGSAKSNALLASIAQIRIYGVHNVVGATDDVAADSIAIPGTEFQVPQVNSIVQSVAFSDKVLYPYFARVVPSYKDQMWVIMGLLANFGWGRAMVISSIDTYGAAAGVFLLVSKEPKAANISFTQITISPTGADFTTKISQVKAQSLTYKIILMFTTIECGIPFLQVMKDNGLMGPNFVYIMSQTMTQPIVENPAAYAQYAHLFNGAIGIMPYGGEGPMYDQVSNLWNNADPVKYPGPRPAYASMWYHFEAMYSQALGMDKIVKAGGKVATTTGSALLKSITKNSYIGVTGNVTLDSSYDRYGKWSLVNFAAFSENVTSYDIRYKAYYSFIDKFQQTGENFTFYGGRTDIPIGWVPKPAPNVTAAPTYAPYRPPPEIYRDHNVPLASGFGAVVGFCVILAIAAAIILAWKWDEFQRHGPFYCAIIIFGVLVSYASALTLLPNPTDALCLAFPWLLGLAFNLVYGCLFIKTWVLYGVFRKAAKCQKVDLTPFYILKILSVFVGVEVVFMLIWTFVDPPQAKYVKLLDSSHEVQCTNTRPIFWGIFLGVKGTWLIFGSVLSFLTRSLAKEYNESKSIAYAIYNDICLIVIAVPLAIALKDVPGGVIIVEVAVVVISFTFTMFSLFFSVWYRLFWAPHDAIGSVSTSPSISARSSSMTGGNTNSRNTNSPDMGRSSHSNSRNSADRASASAV